MSGCLGTGGGIGGACGELGAGACCALGVRRSVWALRTGVVGLVLRWGHARLGPMRRRCWLLWGRSVAEAAGGGVGRVLSVALGAHGVGQVGRVGGGVELWGAQGCHGWQGMSVVVESVKKEWYTRMVKVPALTKNVA